MAKGETLVQQHARLKLRLTKEAEWHVDSLGGLADIEPDAVKRALAKLDVDGGVTGVGRGRTASLALEVPTKGTGKSNKFGGRMKRGETEALVNKLGKVLAGGKKLSRGEI